MSNPDKVIISSSKLTNIANAIRAKTGDNNTMTVDDMVSEIGDLIYEDWDETLYPITDESDELFEFKVFNVRSLNVLSGDTVIIEGVGRGYWWAFYRGQNTGSNASHSTYQTRTEETKYDYLRFKISIDADSILNIGGWEWATDGTHNTTLGNNFRGEYIRYKWIHGEEVVR